nr:rifampin ADP-ribosyl transferase [uncultured bacterium]
MEFNPNNKIIQLCVKGMMLEEKGEQVEAGAIFHQAWNEASNYFEKYLSAYFIAKHQTNVSGKLNWFETALQFALKTDSYSVKSAMYSLYLNIAKCYEDLNDNDNAKKNFGLADSFKNIEYDKGPFYHGTRADLKSGDVLTAGYNSNYQSALIMNHIYFTAIANGAGLAAALANGSGKERVYIVEPTGTFESDPNVTDKKFPGNPTRSYRTDAPLKIVGELRDWDRQTPEDIQKWKEKLENNKGEIIN